MGCFTPPRGGTGHAVCLVRWPERPGGLGYYYLEAARTRSGRPVPPSWYVPIDYELVGGTTSAMRESWKLTFLYVPENIYGSSM